MDVNQSCHPLRRFFLRLFLVALISPHLFCGGVAGLTSGATDTGTTTGGSTADALTGTETQLFDDGPVDMPVTIAKLDSPDLSLITVTVDEISGAQAVKFATGATHRFTITGSAGAGGKLSDGTFAPKFLTFNATTDEQAVATVNADGSFVGEIDGSLADTIVFASMTEAEDQVSPILTVATDASGNFIVTTTNAADLSAAMNVMTDANGNYYFTVKATDGTYTLMRRNVSGSEVETIAESLASEPRVILAGSGPAATVLFEDGSLVNYAEPAPSSVTAFLSKGGAANVESSTAGAWTSQTVDTVGGGLVGEDQSAWPGHSLMFSSTERTVAMTLPYASFLEQGTNNDTLLRFIDLSGTGQIQSVIVSAEFDAVYADVGESGKIYVFASPDQFEANGSDYILYRFDFLDLVDGGVDLAWAARETLIGSFTSTVTSLDVSDNGEVVFGFMISADQNGVGYWSSTSGTPMTINDPENDANFYAYPKVSPDGEFVVFCDVGVPSAEQVETGGDLTVYFPGDPAGTFTKLLASESFNTCTDNPASFFIDSQDRIHFYQTPVDGSDPQLGIIDPRQHAAFEGVELPALE